MLLTGVCSIKRYYELDAIIYIHCIDGLICSTCIIYYRCLYYSCKFMHLMHAIPYELFHVSWYSINFDV